MQVLWSGVRAKSNQEIIIPLGRPDPHKCQSMNYLNIVDNEFDLHLFVSQSFKKLGAPL